MNQHEHNIYKPQSGGLKISDLIKKQNPDNDNNTNLQTTKNIEVEVDEQNDNKIYYENEPISKERRIKPIIRKKKVYIDEKKHYVDHESEKKESDYLKSLIEFIILLTVFIIMSQPFVINSLSSYIQQLNPTDNDNVPFSGIFIYGLILTSLFFATRKILLGKLNILY